MNSLAARAVWEQTGAHAAFLLDQVDGRFPAHSPNPAEKKNLKLLCEQVIINHADLGVAYDGDGDRAAFVDEHGQEITGDQVIILFSQIALANGPQPIVFDQKCSRVVPEFIKARGGTPIMERSGHTYMKRTFLNSSAAYAGELSGHHFLKPFGDDALLASLIFARLVKAEGRPISQRIAEIPAYATTPDLRIPMPEARVQQVLVELEARFKNEAVLSHLDGLRMELPDSWGLVRPSVTEPVITLRFEGTDQQALARILRLVQVIIPEITGELSAFLR
jgi:phosphomannomutase/phosphoglucomutase